MPRSTYNSFKAGVVAGNASSLLEMLKSNAPLGHRLVHPGDSFGRIVAWMWGQDRDETMMFLADYLAELREHQPLARAITPPVSLEELLGGLRLAWPGGVDDDPECEALADYARHQVSRYYGNAV